MKIKIKNFEEFDEGTDFDENDEENKVKKRGRPPRQGMSIQKILENKWDIVPHRNLTSRKVICQKISPTDKKNRDSVQERHITSMKNLFKKRSKMLSVKSKPITKRRAQQIELGPRTISQVVHGILKDYNSVTFSAKAS
jgi:hypothetical protein